MTHPAQPATIRDALRAAHHAGLDRLDAQVLLLHCLARDLHDRAWLIAHDTDALPSAIAGRFDALCARRQRGEPVAYLVGQREFHGLTLLVDARVLDPRPDTETLVDWALDCLADQTAPTVLDLGTGSGAIALALQHRRPDAQVWAVDASADALAVAQANAERLRLPVRFRRGHWLRDWPANGPPTASEATGTPRATPPARFHLIVSNPPYIRADDPHLAALTHEPLQALASGTDGLDDIREIVSQAAEHLMPQGGLLLEHGWDQGDAVAQLLAQAGYQGIEHRLDLAGHVRCTGARRPA